MKSTGRKLKKKNERSYSRRLPSWTVVGLWIRFPSEKTKVKSKSKKRERGADLSALERKIKASVK